MSAEPVPPSETLRMARGLAEQGYRLFPIAAGEKVPALKASWPDIATTETATIESWFGNGSTWNIGLACGLQPNGMRIGAIDVDAHKGGALAWKQLTKGRSRWLGDAPIHKTPNGGWHIFGLIPDDTYGNGNSFPDGIDTRGHKGYVVSPSSVFIDQETGEIRAYTCTTNNLWTTEPKPFPDYVLELWIPPKVEEAIVASQARHPSVHGATRTDGNSAADWWRKNCDYPAMLDADGWRVKGPYKEGIAYHRPNHGNATHHSAVLYDGEVLNVFTQDIPDTAKRVGKPTRDPGILSFSAYAYLAGWHFDGDLSEAGRHVRGLMPKDSYVGGSIPPHPTTSEQAAHTAVDDAWWATRPIFEHIRTAAHAGLASPMATLVACLARSATLIPPEYRLPPVGGDQATLDFLAVIVAPSSVGKGSAAGVARRLIPAPRGTGHPDEWPVTMDMSIGSGEGIAQFFMDPEIEDREDKKVRTGKQIQSKKRKALLFNVDEGRTLVAQGTQRTGATLISTLCTAWSGGNLGQLNAGKETFRRIEPRSVRVCSIIQMQTGMAKDLMSNILLEQGFTGRCLWASAADPTSPDEIPVWPGELGWQPPPGGYLVPVEFNYDPSIRAEIIRRRQAGLRLAEEVNLLHSQQLLVHCKTACILAAWENRRDVASEDWELARAVVNSSQLLVESIVAMAADSEQRTRQKAAALRGDLEAITHSAKDTRRTIEFKAKLLKKLEREPLPWKVLRNLADDTGRPLLREALDDLVGEGAVVLEGARYRLAT